MAGAAGLTMRLAERKSPLLLAAAWLLATFLPAAACDNPQALGTSRVMEVDVGRVAGLGAFQFDTPPLAEGEIILTFDDGPVSWSTPAILDALEAQCVLATFFMIGERAAKAPALVRRAQAAGHTLASHTFSHADLGKLPSGEAEREIVEGYRAVERAALGQDAGERPRLFRFPSFRSTPALAAFARAQGITIVSADMSAQDWKGGPPEQTLERLRTLLDRHGKGILVLHDNQKNTAALLPAFLAELKARGMRIVHMVPK